MAASVEHARISFWRCFHHFSARAPRSLHCSTTIVRYSSSIAAAKRGYSHSFRSNPFGNHFREYMTPSTNILDGLIERGLFQQVFPEEKTDELRRHLIGSPQTIYCGFDPTADSLHIGNLLSIIALVHAYRAGHQVIAILGGATALIGDPSGRTSERKQVEHDTVRSNLHALRKNIEQIFNNYHDLFDNGSKKLQEPLILDNSEWYHNENVIEFLCSAGRNFRMGSMLSRQSVQRRLKSPDGMSLTEFLYQVFQAYDWLYLFKRYGCKIQIGGSDQLGNIVSGYELIQRVVDRPVFGITTPLITNEAGNKLGKSAGNAVWLAAAKTSPFDLYQFFVRLPDSDVERYLRLFTFLSQEEIEAVMSKHKAHLENRTAQKRLAKEVTLLVHGDSGYQSALRCTHALYQATPEHLVQLSTSELSTLFSNATTIELYLEPGTTVVEAVMRAKCFSREDDAERVIRAGGVHFNNRIITAPQTVVVPGVHILPNGLSVVRIGKKNYYLIRWMGQDFQSAVQ